jgi:integrase/recombinase XerD
MDATTANSTLPLIVLEPMMHRNKHWIAIKAPQLESINIELRKLPERKFSKTSQSWLVPLSRENYKAVFNQLKHFARLDTTAMKKWFTENSAAKPVQGLQPDAVKPQQPAVSAKSSKAIKVAKPLPAAAKPTVVKAASSNPALQISSANSEVLPAMKQVLQLKSYSLSTQRTYLNEMSQFLQAIKSEPASNFTTQRLKDYLQYCYATLKLTENTIHSRMNALKFYYEQVLSREKFFLEIPRPKKPQILPKLLNETEIAKLFNALTNKKHKAMLFFAYSAGLRVSEIVNVKIADIDSTRMQIFVEGAKGKKDRYVNLSPVVLDILQNYFKEYKPAPKVYLFESEQTLTAYPTRTVQQIFSNAKNKAGIRKEAGIHSLRHSFATHLLEKGTDIKYIKELLGHFNIKTTERYLHVSKKKLVNIVSPFDDLWSKENIDWLNGLT